MKINISPYKVGLYFYYQCPRHLIFGSLSSEDKIKFNIPTEPFERSPVSTAILEGGYDWEEIVIKNKLRNKVIIPERPDDIQIRDRFFTQEETLEILSSLLPGKYIYQAQLIAPDSLYKSLNLDPLEVEFKASKPDLIYFNISEKKKCLEIIDIKASDRLKTSHKLQVAMYSLILRHMIEEFKLPYDLVSEKGAVWLYEKDEPEYFNLSNVLPHLEDFLKNDLKEFLKSKPHDLPWHLYSKCETCEFFRYCKNEAYSKKSVSLIPHLSVNSRRYLHNLKCETLNDFYNLLNSEQANELLSNSAHFSGKISKYKLKVKALLESKLLVYGGSSAIMPKGENIRIIISIEKEPISGKLYALSFLRYGGRKVFQDSLDIKIFIASSNKQTDKIQREFLKTLYKTLHQIHKYNYKREWKDQLSLQTYVYDNYEYELFNNLLLESLKDSDIAEKVLKLLFYFHSEILFNSDEHPENVTNFPVVKISEVINNLFAVPINVSYSIDKIYEIFKPDGVNFIYDRNDYFDFEYINQLKSEAIFELWNKGKKHLAEKIGKKIRYRLRTKNFVIDGIREKAISSQTKNSLLFAWPDKFLFPESNNFSNPILSKLSFLTYYEKLLEYLKIKNNRLLPLNERINSGNAFILKAQNNNGDSFITDSTEYDYLFDDIFQWLLSEHNEEGDLQQMTFMDLKLRNRNYVPSSLKLHLVKIKSKELVRNKLLLRLDFVAKGNLNISKGKKYLLQPRFIDFNSQKIIETIEEIDEGNKQNVIKLLKNPERFLTKLILPNNLISIVKSLIPKAQLTESQKSAFNHFLKYNLTLIWGPPGTGKTHFIAASLLTIIQAYYRLNKPCHIFICAFTHAAIENCLNKILELNDQLKLWSKNDFHLYKLAEVRNEKFNKIQIIRNENLPYEIENNPRVIVGGTIYALYKASRYESLKFDIIVLDEASQKKVPDALVALNKLKPKGRYLIVGDDKQLPPIILGKYPEDETNKNKLHRSIFEVIRQGDKKGLITCQLLENFRMNESLCKFPSDYIYGNNYRSFSEDIAKRKALLKNMHKQSNLINFIIDPEYPLILCVLDGITSGVENTIEASLVADIVKFYRNNLLNPKSNKIYPLNEKGDKQFWSEGLFVVSPHHKQINRIKAELEKRGLKDPFFVETVEKMQGQETNVGIVSYGLSDPEQAASEAEFIYSLNRLNVAITRAQSKMIVFIPKPLFYPLIEVMENEELNEGISYMLNLKKFMEENGECKKFNLGKDGSVTVSVFRYNKQS